MIKRITSVFLALALALGVGVQPSAANHGNEGYFNSPAIDTNGNGQFDLNICFGAGPGDAIYDNRSQLMIWARDLGYPVIGEDNAGTGHIDGFASNGKCDAGDTANIKVSWNNLGPCYPGGGAAWLYPPSNPNGYTSVTIQFNVNCQVNGVYDWSAPTTDAGKLPAPAIFLHEVGHAFGLKHDPFTSALMNEGGPNNCAGYGQSYGLSGSDAYHIRNRYTGLTDSTIVYPYESTCFD